MLGVLAVYAWWEWRSFDAFVLAIDHHPRFMQDFAGYFYPMGQRVLQDPTPVPGYFYTAFFALLLAPLGALPLRDALVVWGGVQLVCLGLLCVVPARGLLRLSGVHLVLFIGLCLTSFPVLHNTKWGQVSVPITLLVLTAFTAAAKGRRRLAGVVLALATAIKYYPILFLTYFALRGDRRVCVAFLIAFVLLYSVVPALVLGPSNWFAFEKATITAIGTAEWVSSDVNSQYVVHVGLRWFDLAAGAAAGDGAATTLKIAGYGIALLCLALVIRPPRGRSADAGGLAMVVPFLVIPFVVRTSWPHYFAYLPFCQAAVLLRAVNQPCRSTVSRIRRCAPVVLSMLLSSVFVFTLFPDWMAYNSAGMLFLSNAVLLAITVALSLKARSTARCEMDWDDGERPQDLEFIDTG